MIYSIPIGRVVAVGNLLKDQWVSFKEYFDKIRKEEGSK